MAGNSLVTHYEVAASLLERGLELAGPLGASDPAASDNLHQWRLQWESCFAGLRYACDANLPSQVVHTDWPSPLPPKEVNAADVTAYLRGVQYVLQRIGAWLQAIGAVSAPEADDELVLVAGEQYGAWSKLSSVLKRAQREIFLCDPYIGQRTLDLLNSSAEQHVSLRILTLASQLDSATRVAIPLLRGDRRSPLTVRTLKNEELPHDRFVVLDDDQVFLSGASLKDSGRRLSALTPLSEESGRELRGQLDSYWKRGKDDCV